MRPIKIPTWAMLIMALGLLCPADDPSPHVVRADFGVSLVVSLVIAAVAIVLSEVLKPKPEFEDARPAGLGDFKFPTAMENRPQPLIFGTVKMEGPNVVWWGDLRQIPIKETVKTGLWSKKSFIKGYRYNVGVQLGLCRGQINAVRKIWIGDTEVWSGTVQDGTAVVNKPTLFGGDDFGNGGMTGTFRIHSGSTTQAVNSYLTPFQSPQPAYRGLAYAVWEGGYVGNSTSMKPWKFELQRFPNGLALTGGKEIVNSWDANIMNVIYELMTDSRWGFGFPSSDIDTAGFTTAAETLYTEGNGFSMILDKPMDAGTFLKELERQMDGVVYLDQTTGKWKVNLARGGYDVDAITQIVRADGDIVKVKDWNPGTWEALVNEVHVEFNDRQRDYQGTFAKGDNSAGIKVQGRVEPVSLKYPGVKDATLANQIACREVRTMSRPLAKCTLEVTREFWDLNPGDVFAWTDDVIGHTKLPMRATRIDLGTLEKGTITVSAVQDIFSYASGFNGDPQDTGWSAPTQDVEEIPANRHVVFEAPYGLVRRDTQFPNTLDRIWAGGRLEDAPAISAKIYERNSSGTPSGAYRMAGEVFGWLLIGKLKAAMNEDDLNPSTTTDVQLEADDDVHADLLAAFSDTTASDVGSNLQNLLLVDDEFFAPTTVTDQTTYIDLETCYRGMLDTVPADHSVGTKVYLVFVGGNLSDETIPQTNNVDAQLRQVSRTDETTELEAATKQFQMDNRCRRPYPPVEMKINGTRYGTPSWDAMKTGGSTLDDRGYEVEFTRRDWETFNEVDGITTDAATIDSNFPTKHTTEYRGEAIDDPDGSPTSYHTTSWAAAALTFIPRTKLLRAGAGVKSTTLRIDVARSRSSSIPSRRVRRPWTTTRTGGTWRTT
jgi:hypothetical protein